MSKINVSEWEKKLNRIENHIAEEMAPQVNNLLKKSVQFHLSEWYNDYSPHVYQRTNNFMRVMDSVRTSGKGKLLTMTVDSGYMNTYPSYDEEKFLQPSAAFDFMFMDGEHGHGFLMAHRSTPPFEDIDDDICSGFNGRANTVCNNALERILR